MRSGESISLFLEKFRNVKIRDAELKDTLQKAIAGVVGFSVESKDITISPGGKIMIAASPPVRAEILLCKDEILAIVDEYVDRGKRSM